jgi:hypothetical protein
MATVLGEKAVEVNANTGVRRVWPLETGGPARSPLHPQLSPAENKEKARKLKCSIDRNKPRSQYSRVLECKSLDNSLKELD